MPVTFSRVNKTNSITSTDIKESLLERILLYDKIKNGLGTLKLYTGLEKTDNQLVPYGIAVSKIYDRWGSIIESFKTLDFDLLIGGSSGIYSVVKNPDFNPTDMDIYIKGIDSSKLVKIETSLRKTIGNKYKVVVIRKPLVMTWIFWKNYEDHYKIQCNLLKIDNWKEVFITYHSDFLCIGFDVKNEQFVYLEERWDNFLSNDIKSYIANNMFNRDNRSTLSYVSQKYNKRGLYVHPVSIESSSVCGDIELDNNEDKEDSDTEIGSMSDKEDAGDCHTLVGSIMIHTKNTTYLISNTVKDIYAPQGTFPMLNLYKVNISDFNISSNFTNGFLCPILLEKRKIMIKDKKCSESHSISFEAYIKLKSNKCPLCRNSIKDPNVIVFSKY